MDLECAGLLRKPKPQPLHICSRDGFLGADLDSKAGCTELSILLEIHVAAPIIVKRYWAYLSGFSQRACWLTPSQQSPDYYCVSPGYVLPSSLVLNQVLNPDHPLRRNDHLKGFLLGILNEPILDPEDERIGEGVLCLEDLSGEEFWFPIRVGSVGYRTSRRSGSAGAAKRRYLRLVGVEGKEGLSSSRLGLPGASARQETSKMASLSSRNSQPSTEVQLSVPL